MRPAHQSTLARAMRAFEDETQFPSIKGSPTGAPRLRASVHLAVAAIRQPSPSLPAPGEADRNQAAQLLA